MSCCNCCCPSPEPAAQKAAYFAAWQTETLSNSSLYGGLRFQNSDYTKDDFNFGDTIITVITPGTYIARYTIYVPAGSVLRTNIALQMNNVNIPSATVSIDHTATDPAASYSAQAIVHADYLAALRLSSNNIINLTTTNTSALASIIMYKISDSQTVNPV